VASREEPIKEISVQPLLPQRLNRRGPGLAVTALNDSGKILVALGGTSVSPARVLLGAAQSPFTATDTAGLLPLASINDGPLLFFDADGDGQQDLLVTKGGNALPEGSPDYQPQLFLGDGSGGFKPASPSALPPLTNNVGAAVAADFDHSGKLGLFLGGRVATGNYPLAPQSVLLANRGGRFEDVTDALAPGLRAVGMVTAALWSDVDGDGWVDLLLTLEWGQVKFFRNNAGRGFTDRTEPAGFAAAGTGWWTALATADFNGDGQPDYVAGNVGLNTQYRADAQHPALLFSGDFKGDGSNQLIEGYYENEKLFPWRSRRDLGAVLPALLKKFPWTDPYARATLGEILGEDKLAQAERYAATELRSGVFLSQPDHTFRFEPLPRLAQIAPLQGLVTGDFDGDGHADIYAVQNSYAPIPAVGRYDGGLSQLLRGDGQGHFFPVPPKESGLIVPGDAKALAVLDLDADGWPDFLVSRNNSTTLAFRNQGVAGRQSLCVMLRGPAGNPTAIGARVTLELSDGSKQTAEISAGSGYSSQSLPAAFFGYSGTASPQSLHVRWPNGATSDHPAPPSGTTSLRLSAPTK
jgi:hypothetical protein